MCIHIQHLLISISRNGGWNCGGVHHSQALHLRDWGFCGRNCEFSCLLSLHGTIHHFCCYRIPNSSLISSHLCDLSSVIYSVPCACIFFNLFWEFVVEIFVVLFYCLRLIWFRLLIRVDVVENGHNLWVILAWGLFLFSFFPNCYFVHQFCSWNLFMIVCIRKDLNFGLQEEVWLFICN